MRLSSITLLCSANGEPNCRRRHQATYKIEGFRIRRQHQDTCFLSQLFPAICITLNDQIIFLFSEDLTCLINQFLLNALTDLSHTANGNIYNNLCGSTENRFSSRPVTRLNFKTNRRRVYTRETPENAIIQAPPPATRCLRAGINLMTISAFEQELPAALQLRQAQCRSNPQYFLLILIILNINMY